MSNQNYERLFELASALNRQQDYAESLRLVTETARDLLKADVALILMINPQTRETVKTLVRRGKKVEAKQYLLAQQQTSGWIMKFQKPLISADLKSDPRFQKVKWDGVPVHSGLGVPLLIEEALLGTLILFNHEGNTTFREMDMALLKNIALISVPYLHKIQEIQEYFAPPLSKSALISKYEVLGLLGKSTRFVELLEAIDAAARCDVRVLLEGPTGTGKELIAKAIHQLSMRRGELFIAVDCGAIAENLIESELFGYVKGAFTGAITDRTGLIEAANGGTLFMDEITNLPYALQAKLLRVLQENEIRPVGSTEKRKVNVRIIAASSVSLQELVQQGKFREDLFYRLHVYPIPVPLLDERRKDIPLLANHFLQRFAVGQQKPLQSFSANLLDWMKQKHWKGNIRELENFVERLVTFSPTENIVIDDALLPAEFRDDFADFLQQSVSAQPSLAERLAEYERDIILQTLDAANGNQRAAARLLSISESTLRYRMEKLNITTSLRKF